ncbi:hypothetical protein D3C73_1306210 [compost metagenome]
MTKSRCHFPRTAERLAEALRRFMASSIPPAKEEVTIIRGIIVSAKLPAGFTICTSEPMRLAALLLMISACASGSFMAASVPLRPAALLSVSRAAVTLAATLCITFVTICGLDSFRM